MKAKIEAERRAQAMMEKEKEERGQADEIAGAVFEFFESLLPQVLGDVTHAPDPDVRPDLPDPVVPSPDSITVTTVFGVHEEPNNVTVISASAPAPAPTYVTYDFIDPEEGNPEEMNEHLEEVDVTETAMDDGSSADTQDPDDDDDDGDDGDMDTDDFDAESALIDEFFDDGALTPTTTTTASNP